MRVRRTDRGWYCVAAAAVSLCAAVLHAPPAQSQDTAEFTDPDDYLSIVPYVRMIMDEDRDLSPEEARDHIAADGFTPNIDDEWIQMGFMDAVGWMAIPIANSTSEEELMVEFRNPRMSFVDCYIPNNTGGYDEMLNGSARPFDIRPVNYTFPAFPIDLKTGETTEILFRLENIGDWRTRIFLWERETYYNKITTAHDPSKIIAGALGVLAIFHLLVFISLREKAYLYLTFFILAWTGFYMSNTGVGKWLIWHDFYWLTQRASSVFMLLMCASFVIFAMAYLEIKKIAPRLYRFGNIFIGFILLVFLYNAAADNLLRMHMNRALGVLTFLVMTAFVVQSWRSGKTQARFFVASWIFVIIGAALIVLLSRRSVV